MFRKNKKGKSGDELSKNNKPEKDKKIINYSSSPLFLSLLCHVLIVVKKLNFLKWKLNAQLWARKVYVHYELCEAKKIAQKGKSSIKNYLKGMNTKLAKLCNFLTVEIAFIWNLLIDDHRTLFDTAQK